MIDRPPSIAGYACVSTVEQTLNHQLTRIFDYAEQHFDINRADVEIYRGKSTGTDVERSGYQQLVEDIDAGIIDTIVVYEVSRVACSTRDLSRAVDRDRDADAELHVVSEGLTLQLGDDDSYQDALFQLLGVFAELEAKIERKNVAERIAARRDDSEYHHGPASLGSEKEDGRLREAAVYDRVCAVLDAVVRGEMLERQASIEVDTSH